MIIQNNFAAMDAQRNYKINTKNKTKSTQKLSSGYRINMAADDAAGLTISESLRAQIRGLDRGERNAMDGISWMQTGDGALNEVHDILHRMSEITIQSLNDSNTDADRAALQQEFDELQSQIDQIGSTTQFNTKNVFEEHQSTYYQHTGNVVWSQSQRHIINDGENTLTVSYIKEPGGVEEQFTVKVDAGIYTTQELIDELDDAFEEAGVRDNGFNMEYTKEGTCNLNFEGGSEIVGITGKLSYLLNDVYDGGSVGALIGTTTFPYENKGLEIAAGKNDFMHFDILDFNGNTDGMDITIPEKKGGYTRKEMIDYLNSVLTSAGKDIQAVASGQSIKLQSDTCIITGFKGNMFKVDSNVIGESYTSVFYDNIQYGTTIQSPAEFKGGLVVTNSMADEKNNHFVIDSTNNKLGISVDGGIMNTITIPEGNYSVSGMAETLTRLFRNNGVNAYVNSYGNEYYSGLSITTNSEGIDSKIEFDTSSSAYNTLFTDQTYAVVNAYPQTYAESRADSPAYVTGAKVFDSSHLPLVVTAGINDEFKLVLDNSSTYTIKLDAGTYSSVNSIRDAINDKLDGSSAMAGYKGKLSVGVVNNQIKLTSITGSGVTSVRVEKSGTNTGYNDIFVREDIVKNVQTVKDTGTATRPASITLNTKIDNPVTLDNTNNSFIVTVDGINRPVNLDSGTYTHDELVEKINEKLAEKIEKIPNTFTALNVYGTTTANSVTINGSGNTSVTPFSASNTGVSDTIQGIGGATAVNIPAMVTVTKPLGAKTVIDSSNNEFAISIEGDSGPSEKMIRLDAGEYTPEKLRDQIQKKIDEAFSKYYGGAKVSLDQNNQLVFTARTQGSDGKEYDGRYTYISINNNNGSFLRELFTTRTQAKAVSSKDMASSIKIDDSTNTFSFTYNDGMMVRNVNLTLSNNTYTPQTFANELNTQLAKQGIDVKASTSGNKLVLTSGAVGNGVSISYSNQNGKGGTSEIPLFGDVYTKAPATGTVNLTIKNPVVIDDNTNKYNIKVNGTTYNIDLDNGSYSQSGFVSMLNQKFRDGNVPVTASLNGGKITYTTTTKGADSSIYQSYTSMGSSAEALYGSTTKKTPGVTAEMTGDGKLKLTTIDNNKTIQVSSNNGGAFQSNTETINYVSPSAVAGYSSNDYAYIDGANITSPVDIYSYNKQLRFTFKDQGADKFVNIILPEKSYTFDELKTTLNTLLDNAVGSGKLEAKVDANGVRIECKKPGSTNTMRNFSGGFYYYVLCDTREYSTTVSVSNKAGTQSLSPAFAVGRRDIKNEMMVIERNVNDNLEFDLTYGNKVEKISVTIAAGNYSGDALVKELQEKINEELVKKGINEDFIKAQIGGVNTGVAGANDSNALCLIQNKNVNAPAEGDFIIDGVRGSAAFTIFYQSEGKMETAYVKGAKDLSGGVKIDNTNNQLNFEIDGTAYGIVLDEGDYTSDEIIK